MQRKRVGIVHPVFGWGGTEAVCAWTLMSLCDSFDTELLTFDRNITFEKMDRFYGTKLSKQNIKIKLLRAPEPFHSMESGYHLLRQHYIMKEVKKLKDDYDILFSTYNEMDFGVRGIQYIHFPYIASFEHERLKEATFAEVWYHKPSPIRWWYEKLGCILSSYNPSRMKQNVTLVNSNWTGKIVWDAYEIDTITVYPPVNVEPKNTTLQPPNFLHRDAGFVAIGRIEPTKRFIEIVKILSGVRVRGYDVHLHIAGKVGDHKYFKKLKELQRENYSWLFIEDGLTREDLARLISSHRFGIHGKINEHFGIAVAEMVKLGCVVFVHNSGGQIEAVGGDERLMYTSEGEAVEKIVKIIHDASLQMELHENALKQGTLFSVENYMNSIKRIVEDF